MKPNVNESTLKRLMRHSERSEESINQYEIRDSSVASLLQNDIVWLFTVYS